VQPAAGQAATAPQPPAGQAATAPQAAEGQAVTAPAETSSTSHPAPDGTPANGGEPPATDPAQELEALKDELEQSPAVIAEQEQAASTAQSQAKQAKSRATSLQQLLNEIEAGQAAIATQQAAATDVGDKAYAEDQALWGEIDSVVEDECIELIDAAITEIDQAITDARTAFWEARDDAAKAATDAANAQADLTDRLAAEGAARTAFRQLPNEIKQASNDVDRLLTETHTAVEAGKFPIAYTLHRDLEGALGALSTLVDEGTETERLGALLEAWTEARDAEKTKAEADANVAPAKAKAAEAEKAFNALRVGRTASIREAVAKLRPCQSSGSQKSAA
jgi:hypothetical protein